MTASKKISRRRFLQTAAAGIGGITLGFPMTELAAQQKEKAIAPAKPKKKILGSMSSKSGGRGSPPVPMPIMVGKFSLVLR